MIVCENVVMFAAGVELTDQGAKGSGFLAPAYTTANCEFFDVEPPRPFMAGWYTYIDGVFGLTEEGAAEVPKALAAAAKNASAEIDAQAEQQRLRFITDGAGQALEYEETAKELIRFREAVAPDPVDYPYLSADLGILGDTVAEVAATIEQLQTTWRAAGPIIKRIRRQAKAAVGVAQAAGDLAAIEAATAVDWSPVDQAVA